jgi:hypothetical protein
MMATKQIRTTNSGLRCGGGGPPEVSDIGVLTWNRDSAANGTELWPRGRRATRPALTIGTAAQPLRLPCCYPSCRRRSHCRTGRTSRIAPDLSTISRPFLQR